KAQRPPSFTTAPATRSTLMKSSGSGFERLRRLNLQPPATLRRVGLSSTRKTMANPTNRKKYKYSLDILKKHWSATSADFAARYADCRSVFDAITHSSSSLIEALAHRKALAPNCAYLLLAKSLNHAFATLTLLQRGLIIDA